MKSRILSQLLSSLLGLSPVQHILLPEAFRGKISQSAAIKKGRISSGDEVVFLTSQTGQNIVFSFFFPRVCLRLMHLLPSTMGA